MAFEPFFGSFRESSNVLKQTLPLKILNGVFATSLTRISRFHTGLGVPFRGNVNPNHRS